MEYTSSSFTDKMIINDKEKNGASLSIKDHSDSIVYWKRYLKRDSSHYLGADDGQGRSEWTIVGDNKRFIFVIAYKQKPKPQAQILFFGRINDHDGIEKTVLVGYITNELGNNGFNHLFSFKKWKIKPSGELYCFKKLDCDYNRKQSVG